jgi:hypothetical protein
MIAFARCEPARNLDRFYVLAMTRDLFDGWVLWREWGRRGSPGTLRNLRARSGGALGRAPGDSPPAAARLCGTRA